MRTTPSFLGRSWQVGIFALAIPASAILLGSLGGCEDETTPPAGPTIDGSVNLNPGPNGEAGARNDAGTSNDAGGPPGVCTEAAYVNGTVADPPNGTMSHHAENRIDAVVVMMTGTMPCEAKFDANGGVLVKGTMSGEYNIQCNGTKDAEYYGLHIHGLGKLGSAGAQYPIGKAAVVNDALNNQVDFTWESGSRCGSKAATLREWEGGPSIPGRGLFTVDAINGSVVQFHISPTDMKVSAKNVDGTGTFTLDVIVVDATPFTIVGL